MDRCQFITVSLLYHRVMVEDFSAGGRFLFLIWSHKGRKEFTWPKAAQILLAKDK